MAYSINPNLPKARAIAMQLLVREQLPLLLVANRCGVHRSTLWRWKQKWDKLNQDWQLDNPNRPSRPIGVSKYDRCYWQIPTRSSRPHSHKRTVPDSVVQIVLRVREELKRCAEVIWHYVTTVLGMSVSLSSVRRILRRHHCFDGARKPRVKRDNPKRPHVTRPGELVETDTIHHVDPRSGRRLYYYTVIDLFTRMTHVTVSTQLRQGLAAQAVLEARAAWSALTGSPACVRISMVQSDNGPEYGRYFEQQMKRAGIQTRHSRLHRPNDNAHIERFNRTIQEECIGSHWRRSVPLHLQQEKLNDYLAYYNNERVHLGLQLRTPAEMLQRF